MKALIRSVKSRFQLWFPVVVLGADLSPIASPNARAQLAITEVMSDAATNCTGIVTSHPDFMEITNYGTNHINLAGYRFWDMDLVAFDRANPLPDTTIAPNESIIFVRESRSVPDAAAFRAWWGEAKLPANLRIYFYKDPGFNGEGEDAVRLWDANTNVVDEVFFDQAVLDQGITFVSDTHCGQFGVLSQVGVCGAFKAASCDDIGSPGFAPCGPVPLFITQQPVSQTVDAGSSATFRVRACGLPRPPPSTGYQWYFNGAPIARPLLPLDPTVAVSYAGCGLAWTTQPDPSDLVIPEVQPSHAGQYFAVVTNGLERMTSAVVTLTVNTDPTPPRIECPADVWWFPPIAGQRQTNLIVSLWQTAFFEVKVRAYPSPTFRWSWSADGTAFNDMFGATNHSLILNYVRPSDAGIYRVRVQNEHGTAYAYATLTVTPKPALKITETMPYTCPGPNNDWWELTNTNDEPVNLTGYRWNDFPYNVGGGPTLTEAMVIQPGESVILMESQTRQSFLEWWGADNLPPNLQCIVHNANGLTETGDGINLWNPWANDEADFIDTVVFGTATQGATFWFDFDFCEASEPGWLSVEGDCGAFRAANGCDVGSPGWTRWTPPRFTGIQREGPVVRLWWKAQPGSTNRLEFTRELAPTPGDTVWTGLGTFRFAEATGTTTDPVLETDSQRFYRIVRISPANCNCP